MAPAARGRLPPSRVPGPSLFKKVERPITGRTPSDAKVSVREGRHGNRMDYILTRLKREAATNPKARQALDGIAGGATTSARQAGILAGFIKVPTALKQPSG
jgi:hypothetical protein